MALSLTIENHSNLPDGGPLSVTITGKRGIDIGRDQHLDWTLPDPSRAISGKHCEVRWQDGAYWLYDVSTNGTFLNRSDHRMPGPHRLRDGDRIEIGHYIIRVTLEEAAAETPAPPAPAPVGRGELWGPAGEAAPPVAPRDLAPQRAMKPVRPDFLDWAVDTPAGAASPPPAPVVPPAQGFEDMSWAQGAQAAPPPVFEPPPMPSPRRPSMPSPDLINAWTSEPAPEPPPPASAMPAEFGGPFAQPSAPPAAPAAMPRATPLPIPPAAAPAHSPSAPPEPMPSAGFPPPAPPRQPTAPPEAVYAPMPAAQDPASAAEFRRRFAKGAGLPPDALDWQDPGEFAEMLGVMMRIVATDVKQLLNARAESKRMTRSTNQTMIQAADNNPLKFAPTVDDALRIMFGRPVSGYLDARKTLEHSFKDLKGHQVKTYSAMQHAVRLLFEDLDPQVIEDAIDMSGRSINVMTSRKTRLWDTFVARFDAKTAPYENGLVDAFMIYFSECYDRSQTK